MAKIRINEARKLIAEGAAMVETFTPNDHRNRWGDFSLEVGDTLLRLNTKSAVALIEQGQVKEAFKQACRYNPSNCEIHYKALEA
jgi:hypothetical protein